MAQGMTPEERAALDHFAGIAMQYMMEDLRLSHSFHECLGDPTDVNYTEKRKEIAKASYEMALFMVAARREVR